MLSEFLASGTLNLVYAGVVFTSFIFALVTLFGAEMGDALHLDLDLDTDVDGGTDFISVSPFALAIFGAAFGMTGLVTRLWLELDSVPSILWATGVGLIIGVSAQVFFIYVLSPSKSSHFSLSDDAVGRDVEVITTIPGNGLGEIAFDNVSGRVKLGARSSTGKQIKRGALVKIERVTGRVAVVHPIEES
ncbi:MAG: NfeD family protein [Ardenticatenaceae bacterium]|nr:NfeD family protein [Anaerolineales bacterium]MCB8920836.1 NfeD family protein [Ardenticatenaceae bacterium]MCB8991648.1 NfeD family protein [Ardenticatenaceae bacterium]MCB9002746.1 NfeD family protein [Ardenticatenaceae bacterium]